MHIPRADPRDATPRLDPLTSGVGPDPVAAGPPVPGPDEASVEVLVRRFDRELPVPAYAHAGDAGADLVTAQDVTLGPGERAVVGTGIGIALPAGYAAFVHPRSGLAARHGLSIVNAPGTVDAGYRGEIKVVLVNTDSRETVRLMRGDRVAQLVVQRVERAAFTETAELPATLRGTAGFGSTGGFASAAVAATGSDLTTTAGDGQGVSAQA
ncbi:MAG: dUTP diphosphatase [Frankia sp.]